MYSIHATVSFNPKTSMLFDLRCLDTLPHHTFILFHQPQVVLHRNLSSRNLQVLDPFSANFLRLSASFSNHKMGAIVIK